MDIDKQQIEEFVTAAKVTMARMNDVLDRMRRLLDWALGKTVDRQ